VTTNRGTAIVTGGASGLGASFAIGLGACGHDVAILDLQGAEDVATQIEALGARVLHRVGDASNPDEVATFISHLSTSDLSPTRVLVNNAGISPYAPFAETDLQTWHQVLRVNLDSLYLMTHMVLPSLLKHGAGRIVNISSSVVWDAQVRDMTAYATSKAAIVGFTRALAGEVGVSGVTVNAIAPGIVLTPDIQGRVSNERLEIYRGRQSIPLIAEPDDIVGTLLYLIDEGTRLVTGATLPVNGGRVFL